MIWRDRAAFLYSYLANEPTVGFHLKEFTWYQYLFTECRVLFIYLRLFYFPFGQMRTTAIDLSHTPFEHGAILGMAAILGATVAADRLAQAFSDRELWLFRGPDLLSSDLILHAHRGSCRGAARLSCR